MTASTLSRAAIMLVALRSQVVQRPAGESPHGTLLRARLTMTMPPPVVPQPADEALA